jgi:glycerate dehydrogenase
VKLMNIIVLDGYTLNPGDLSWSGLEQLGQLEIFDRTSPEQVVARAVDAEIVLTNKTELNAMALEQLPKLRYIGVLATGYDVVDAKAAADRNIVVTNVPAYGTNSVAEHVFALLLELSKRSGLHSRSVEGGEWSMNKDWCYWHKPLFELAGKTLGIVGTGRIGLKAAKIAHVFGMKVIAVSRSKKSGEVLEGIHYVDLQELFRISDFISLHCPLTVETEGMINSHHLQMMKKSAFLINTSRGKLVVESDLADALNNELIAGAGLDVLSSEPPASDNPLLHAKNCIITPHVAWASRESRSRLLDTAIENVSAFLNGKYMHVVNGVSI